MTNNVNIHNIKLQRKHIAICSMISISLTIMSTDLFLPSFPSIAKTFFVSQNAVQQNIGSFALAAAISALICGPLSDVYGRRLMLFWGMIIFTAGSIGCALAPSNWSLILFRFLQGIGSGCSGCVGTAAVQDVYTDPKEVTKIRSYLGIGISVSPIIGPPLGGYIEQNLHWRYGFSFLTIIGILLCFYVYFYFFETNKIKTQNLKFSDLIISKIQSFANIAKSLRCSLYLFAIPIFLMSGIAILAVSTFYVQNILKIPPQTYGWLITLSLTGYMLGSVICIRIVNYIHMDKIILTGMCLGAFSLIFQIIIALYVPYETYLIIIGMWLFTFSQSLIFGPSTTSAMAIFPNDKGTVASYTSMLRYIFFFFAAQIAYFVPDDNFLYVCLICLPFFIVHILLFIYNQLKSVST